MANRQQTENDVRLDLKSILDTAGISNVITEDAERPDAASFVVVKCINLRGALQGGTLPSGMEQADCGVEAWSLYDDDKTGTTLQALVGSIRQAIWVDDILTQLNSASTYHTYYALLEGPSLPDTDGRWRIQDIQFSLILKPEKA